MTVSDIAGRIIGRIDDDPAAPVSVAVGAGVVVNGVMVADEVLAAINEGQMLCSLLTLCLEKTAAFPLGAAYSLDAAGAFYLPRPILTDLIAPLRIAVGGIRLRPSTIENLDAWNSAWQNTAGPAARYALLGSNLWAVTPQSAQTAQVTYAYSPAALGVNDTPVIPPSYHPDLVEYGVYRVRLKEGAQQLARGVECLNVYLDSMTRLGDYVRARSLAAHYDVQPFELAKFDRSELAAAQGNDEAFQSTPGTPDHWYEDDLALGTVGLVPVPIAVSPVATICNMCPPDLDVGQVNVLVQAPAPVATYLAFSVLEKAYGQEGESEQPDLAQHCQGRADMLEQVFQSYYGKT